MTLLVISVVLVKAESALHGFFFRGGGGGGGKRVGSIAKIILKKCEHDPFLLYSLGLTLLPHPGQPLCPPGLFPLGVSTQHQMHLGHTVSAAGSLVPVTVGFPGMLVICAKRGICLKSHLLPYVSPFKKTLKN